MKNLNITLNEQHTSVVIKALELYTRIGTGQLNELFWHPALNKIELEKLEQAMKLLHEVKQIAFPHLKEPGDCLAIRNEDVSIESKNAYDILQVIKHEWVVADNKKDMEHSIWRGEPKTAGNQPLIECKIQRV